MTTHEAIAQAQAGVTLPADGHEYATLDDPADLAEVCRRLDQLADRAEHRRRYYEAATGRPVVVGWQTYKPAERDGKPAVEVQTRYEHQAPDDGFYTDDGGFVEFKEVREAAGLAGKITV